MTIPGADGLTEQQRKLVAFVEGYRAEHSRSPSVREIARALDSSYSSVHYHLHRLKDMGRVDFEPGLARTLIVIGSPKRENRN